eukprot:m.456940 g.456940  ORF g.456940 m.456940 type:complete len:662 (-) comp56980_c0_seq4:1700-3685(-)
MASGQYEPFADEDDEPELLLTATPKGSGGGYRALPAEDEDTATLLIDDSHITANQRLLGEKFRHQKDLDQFFENAYTYYTDKGLQCVLLDRILKHLGMLFIVVVWIFVFVCVDYTQLEHHIMNPVCGNSSANNGGLFTEDCFGNQPISFARIKSAGFFVYLTLVCFFVYWGLEVYKFYKQVPAWLEMRVFYEQVLQITPRSLQTISWDAVLKKLVVAQREFKLCITVSELDQVDIVSMICRQDNFYSALFQQDWFPQYITVYGYQFFTPILEWNIQRCIKGIVFTERHTVHEKIQSGAHGNRAEVSQSMKTMFKILAGANLLLIPFIALIRITSFLFQNADEWRKRPASLGLRQWAPVALHQLRDFNELKHVFDHRLRRCYEPTQKYIGLFTSEYYAVIARFIVFVFGGILLLFVGFSLVFDDELLLATFFAGRSVGWWFAAVGVIVAIGRALLPDETVPFEPADRLAEAEVHAHFFSKYKGAESNLDTYEAVSKLLQLKLVLFVEEVVGLLAGPYILFFLLPEASDRIIAFFKDNTTSMPGIGDVCSAAVFKTQAQIIREAYLGSSVHGSRSLDALDSHWADKAMRDKRKIMDSMIHFKTTHPGWVPDSSSQAFFDDVDTLRADSSANAGSSLLDSLPSLAQTTQPARRRDDNDSRTDQS